MSRRASEGKTSGAALRVLLVTQPTTAGTARHVADLAAGLHERGVDVTVACPDEGVLPRRLERDRVPYRVLPMSREIRPLSDLIAFVRLLLLIRRIRPDVLHLHSSKAGFLGRIAGRLAGAGVVVFTPHCWSFQSATGRKRRFYLALERFASRFADMTVTVSDQERREAIEEGVLTADRVRVIPNGVGPSDFEAARSTRQDIPFVSVGRLDEQKGYSYLLQALADLSSGEPDARLSIVGDGSLRGQLEHEAAALGVSDRVTFEGERTDVGSYLRRARTFVLSSLWEGLPYTIIEAMAAGLPVICTDVGGCRELVEDGRTGFVVPPRDPGALAAAMRRLLHDDAMRAAMGAAGFERASTLYRVETCVERNAALYRELTAKASQRAALSRSHRLFSPTTTAAVLIAALVMSGGLAASQLSMGDTIARGVRVADVSVGGLTRDGAVATIARRVRGPVSVAFDAEATDETAVRLVDVRPRAVDAVERAYLVGRVGGALQRFRERMDAARGRVSVPIEAQRDATVEALIAEAHSIIDKRPVDAHFEVADGELVIVPDEPGARVDENAFVRALGAAALRTGPASRRVGVPTVELPARVTVADAGQLIRQAEAWTARPVEGTANDPAFRLRLSRETLASLLTVSEGELSVSRSALSELVRASRFTERAPKDARFTVTDGRLRIIEGKPGITLDVAATAAALEDALAVGRGSFSLALEKRQPTITASDLRRTGISRLLASYTTRFRVGQDGRDVNINLAAARIRGTVLGIGETFSLNEITGPRNKATGYKESLIFSNGKVVPGIGGGVCQVSSTTYQAALRAGMKIVERRSHSMAVTYLAPGLDATAFYPTVDLKFQNTRSSPVLVWTAVEGNRLTVSIYGSGKRPDVRIDTTIKQTIRYDTREVFDRALAPGQRVVEQVGVPGYVVASYRFFLEDGRVTRREPLAVDEYQPRHEIVRVGY